MTRGPDASVLLARALTKSAAEAGGVVSARATATSPWVSATFSGSRHAVALTGVTFVTFDAWLAGLAEADLPLAGHIVADLSITSTVRDGDRFRVGLEALTVEVERPPVQPRVASRRNMPSVS